MTKTDPMSDPCPHCPRPKDVLAAIGLLTRLPISVDTDQAQARAAIAPWAYPLVGLVVGGLAAVMGYIALWFDISPTITAGLAVVVMIVVTGALHEDGLADTCDGLWGGWDRERRLQIMKDSKIGTYGVLGLILSVILRWAGYMALIEVGFLWAVLLLVPMISRAPMVVLMATLPHARTTGLSHSVGRPVWQIAVLACVTAAILGLVIWPAKMLAICVVLAICTFGIAKLARAKIGGQTGDILGASQQISEIAVLLVLVTTV
ncbi:adenosylcobinamide-GDP ribazoletransferase [Aestuariibius sp. HNIBRBA575]|uniref:adenosylcobinamide-GDP ribazoletransferase n=1 Tax=Aestuariibius sp. HNIBRBA575 TaxID=3233343 RepID=UPI0034A52CDE